MRIPASALALPEGRRGALLAVTVLALAMLIAWFGVAQPLIGWYRWRADRLARQQSLVQHMATLAASLPTLKVAAERARARGSSAGLVAGDTDAVAAAALQSAIEDMARRNGARIASIAILPGEPAGNWRRIALRLSVQAPLAVVMGLLQAVLQTATMMAVDDLSLSRSALEIPGKPALMDAEFTVYAFRRATAPGFGFTLRQAASQ